MADRRRDWRRGRTGQMGRSATHRRTCLRLPRLAVSAGRSEGDSGVMVVALHLPRRPRDNRCRRRALGRIAWTSDRDPMCVAAARAWVAREHSRPILEHACTCGRHDLSSPRATSTRKAKNAYSGSRANAKYPSTSSRRGGRNISRSVWSVIGVTVGCTDPIVF